MCPWGTGRMEGTPVEALPRAPAPATGPVTETPLFSVVVVVSLPWLVPFGLAGSVGLKVNGAARGFSREGFLASGARGRAGCASLALDASPATLAEPAAAAASASEAEPSQPSLAVALPPRRESLSGTSTLPAAETPPAGLTPLEPPGAVA